MAFATGRVSSSGDATISVSATNVTNPAGGEGATKGTGYSQVCSSPFIAKINANTTSTLTFDFEGKGGDWRCITLLWIPIKGKLITD